MEAIRSMHADFYDLPDDTRHKTHNPSADSLKKIKILEEEVAIDAIIADHLADFELGGDGYPMYQSKGPTHASVYIACTCMCTVTTARKWY